MVSTLEKRKVILNYLSARKALSIYHLIVVFSLAAFLRMYLLGTDPPGLYTDELQFMLSAYNQLHSGILSGYGSFGLAGSIWVTIDGYIPSVLLFHTTPFAARFPVALYGSLIVFPLYLLTKEITKNNAIALIASSLWAVDPLSVTLSRVGYGVELFPLFLYLFFLLFLLKYLNYGRSINVIIASAIFLVIMYFPTLRTWAAIPAVSILVYFFVIKVSGRWKSIKSKMSGLPIWICSVVLAVSVIWALLYLGPLVTPKIGLANLFGDVNPAGLVMSLPFPHSVWIFLSEIEYGLSPWKLFWISEFTSAGVGTSINSVASMLVFLAPFFYYSVFILPFRIRHSVVDIHNYYLLIALIFFGVMTPSFFYVISPRLFEPGEGIFALPPCLVLSSISILRFVEWVKRGSQRSVKKSPQTDQAGKIKVNRKRATAILIAVILVGSIFVNIAVFSNDYYVSYPEYVENNQTRGIWYGWEEISYVLVDTGLYKLPIFYTPGIGGDYDLENPNNFNYFFNNLHYPQYWLYSFSGGTINSSVKPIYYGNLPNLTLAKEVVLSQNPNYTKILSDANISNHVIFTVFKPDGTIAIQIILVTPKQVVGI